MISQTFDIREHLETLEPGKGKNKYKCPVCEGRNLSVEPKTGAFKCWSGDCASADIREAIRPLSEFLAEVRGDQPTRQTRKPKAQKKEYPPTPIPSGTELLRMPAASKPPRAERPKYYPKGVPGNAAQITYQYSNSQKVLRFEWAADNAKGRDKTYRQVHIDISGKEVWSKGDLPWPAYGLDKVVEVVAGIPEDKPVAVLMLEGEPNVELARSHGIAAFTMQGSNWNHSEMSVMVNVLRATGKQVVLAVLRDNDAAGIKKASEVQSLCRWAQSVEAGIPCLIIDPRVIHPDIPEAGDIKEILEAIGVDEFLLRVNAEIAARANNLEPLPALDKTPSAELDTKLTLTLKQWRKRRQYTPTVRCNSKYVQLLEPAPNTITAIKAPLGGGKTQWLAEVVAAVTLGKIFLLGHRNALLRGTSKRCGFYHITFDNGQAMISDPNGRVASCVDSLQKFPDDSADENCTIVLDEVESVIRAITGSKTISASDRSAILDRFARLLNSASRIIVMDGHLTDRTVRYISSLAPGKVVTKYENTFKAALVPKVEIFKGSRAPQIEAFKDLIIKARRPAIFVDSKDDAKAIHRQLEEVHGAGAGILLTADNATEDLQAEFVDNPQKSIAAHNWAYIVATPLLQDGVDISTPDYFSEIFGLFRGVIGVNSICQMVRRVRHPIGDIKILCAAQRLPLKDGGELYAAHFQKLMADRMAADISEFDERSPQEIQLEIFQEMAQCLHTQVWMELKILENIEQPYLYDFVCELLRESGHEVLELDIESADTQIHKQVKQEVLADYAEDVAMAKTIPIVEAEKILSRQGTIKITEADIHAANRAVIADQLPGVEITSSLVIRLKKERGLLTGMRMRWNLENPDKAKQLRGYRYEEGKMKVFGSDHRLSPQMLRALIKLDIGKFLDCDRSFCNDSPEILAVAEWGKGKEAARLDLKIMNDTPMKFCNRLLATIGVKLVKAKIQIKGQARQYSYTPAGGSLPADFDELYAAVSSKMLKNWQEKVEKKASEKCSSVSPGTVNSTSVQAVAHGSDILYNNVGGGATEIKEDLTPICPEPVMAECRVETHQLEAPPIANLTGWVQRWGKYYQAKVTGWCEAGTQYIVQSINDEFSEMMVWPDKLLCECP